MGTRLAVEIAHVTNTNLQPLGGRMVFSADQSRWYHLVRTPLPVRCRDIHQRKLAVSRWPHGSLNPPKSTEPPHEYSESSEILTFYFWSLTGTGLFSIDQSRWYHSMSTPNPVR
jgi:hypothetical protein